MKSGIKRIIISVITAMTLLFAASVFVSAELVSTPLDFNNVGDEAGQTRASGDGYSWNEETKTLTLDNFVLNIPASSSDETYGIKLPAGSTIELNGDNTISVGAAGSNSYGIVVSDGDIESSEPASGEELRIIGSNRNTDKLTVTAGAVTSKYSSSYGLYLVRNWDSSPKNLVCSKCTLTFKAGKADTSQMMSTSYGAYIRDKITLDKCDCTFEGNSSENGSFGIKTDGSLEMKNSASLKCESGSEVADYGYSCAAYISGDIEINKSCTLTANSNSSCVTNGNYADAVAVYTDAGITNWGTINAKTGSSSGQGSCDYAIYSGNIMMIMPGGSISALSEDGKISVKSGKAITAVGNYEVKNVKETLDSGKSKSLSQNGTEAISIIVNDGPVFVLGNGKYGKNSDDHTWAGYDFVGWYDNAEYSGSAIETGFENGKFYYAKWKLNDDEVLVNPLDFTKADAPESGRGFTWNAGTKTLTLDNFKMKITSEYEGETFGINLPDGATIVLADGSKNTITSGTTNGTNYAVHSIGALNICGAGKLEATGGRGNWTFGIHAAGELNNSADIKGVGGIGDVKSFGIYADGLVSNSGKMTAIGTEGENANGLYLMKGINNTGDIIAIAGTGRNMQAEYANGINSKTEININAGHVKATGGYASEERNGIWANGPLNIAQDAEVELYLNENFGSNVWCLDCTKITVDYDSVLDVHGTISSSKYGGVYTVYGAQVSETKLTGNKNMVPTLSSVIKIRKEMAAPNTLFMASVVAGNKKQIVSWNAVEGADRYTVYYARSGKKMKKVKTLPAYRSSYTKRGLSNYKKYKFRVYAYTYLDGKWVKLATSQKLFTAGKKANRSNTKEISLEKITIVTRVGKTEKLGAYISKKSSKRTLLYKGYCNKIRYMSSNQSIASVDDNGNIVGTGQGLCYIYAIAPNGLFKAAMLKVK